MNLARLSQDLREWGRGGGPGVGRDRQTERCVCVGGGEGGQ